MKKLIWLFLIFSMALSLCACGTVELPPLPEFPTVNTPAPEATPSYAVTPAPTLSPVADGAVAPPIPAVSAAPEASSDAEAPAGEDPLIEGDSEASIPGEDTSAVPALAAAEETQPSRVIVTFQSYSEKVKDPATGEIDILNFAYVTPVVYLEGRDLAAARINEYMAMLDESFYTGNDYGAGTVGGFNYMLEIAEDNFTYIWENRLISATLEYSATRDVRVERADDKLLNLVFEYYEFTGGAHGSYTDRASVFDTTSGETLTLDKLTDDYDALVSFLVDKMLEQTENDERIAPDYIAEADRPEAFRSLLGEGTWYFDNEGLVIFSNPYEIGPYAAGIIDFHVPYAELAGRIDKKWLPDERNESGIFSIYPLEEKDENVVLLDRVVLDDNARELCLLAEGTVYDVALASVGYVGDGQFNLGMPVWHCSYMNDCALQLAIMIPDATPNLMLRYRTANGEMHNLLITESGEDGHPMLVDGTLAGEG